MFFFLGGGEVRHLKATCQLCKVCFFWLLTSQDQSLVWFLHYTTDGVFLLWYAISKWYFPFVNRGNGLQMRHAILIPCAG